MDQDSFRQLLGKPGASSGGYVKSRGSLLAPSTSSKSKKISSSEPAFKPRKVKKAGDEKYRDRAAERRVGDGVNVDFAGAEAVLDEFERKNAGVEDKEAVEEQRRYLGGDGEHSVLVKGIDFALLEQNRARAHAAGAKEDDEFLDQAFAAPVKKRTRKELLQELKDGRAAAAAATEGGDLDASALEEAKKAGKFKPIGSADNKGKRKKAKGAEGERKKKKRKVEVEAIAAPAPTPALHEVQLPTPTLAAPVASEPEEPDVDVDIFAGFGDYQGLDFGDGDDDDDEAGEASPPRLVAAHTAREASVEWGPWFNEEPAAPSAPLPLPAATRHQDQEMEDGEEESHQPMRLVPLSSSALPSIKDFLAMDKAASNRDKAWRKKADDKRKTELGEGSGPLPVPDADDDGDDEGGRKKGKGKGKGKAGKKEMTAEEKAERDYKRLKAYEDKKGGNSKS